MNFLRVILNKIKKDRIRNTNMRLELVVDEIKNDIQKSIINMAWTCDAYDRREDT